MAEISEKLERVHALAEIRLAMRELYFNYDELDDDAADDYLNGIQGSVQLIRTHVQKRRSERAPEITPPQR